MPADPPTKSAKRSLISKRGAIACVRCKERKAKCVPAPPGTSNVPTCTNCFSSKADCVYLDRTPNEIFLLEYVSQLEARVAVLEMELSKYSPTNLFVSDHSHPRPIDAAVESLTQQYPPETHLVDNSAEVEDENTDLAVGIGLLSLSGSGEPLYVGASSGVNWARVCATALRRPRSQPSYLSRFSYQAPPEKASIQSALSYTTNHPTPPLPTTQLANRYISVAYTHIQARYGCFDWPAIRNWHENREGICLARPMLGAGQGEDQRRLLASFFLWLCYGYGARLTEDEHLEGAVSHEVYYNTAVACLSTLTSQHSLATVQALLLLTIYSFRHPRAELSIWQVGGLALRTAVELGLHRRTRSKKEREKDPLRYEMKKRVFWAVYTLDRMMALQLGRPSGIQDRDIDVELPLNIDVDYTDSKGIYEMQNRQIEQSVGRRPGDEYNAGYGSITSMTSSIHNVRLNQCKQDIQDAIYRLDTLRPRGGQQSLPEIDSLLSRLGQWKNCHPFLPPGRAGVPLLSKEHFDMEYHNCVQVLLRPVVAAADASREYIKACAASAASLCEIQCDLLQPIPVSPRLSTWALYRLFLSGLTLLHVSSSLGHQRAASALHKCQDTLAIFTRSFPGAAGYQACFTELVSAWEARGVASVPIKQDITAGPSYRPYQAPAQSQQPMFFATGYPNNQNFSLNGPLLSFQPIQNTSPGQQIYQDMSLPLLGSPKSTEAFSDMWADRLGEMGGKLGGGMRDDFFSLMSSFGLDQVLESVEESLPAVGEDDLWSTTDWDTIAAQSQPARTISPQSAIGGLPYVDYGLGGLDVHAGMGEWLGFFDQQQS